MTPSSKTRTLLAVVPGVALVALGDTLLDVPRADFVDALASDRYRILWITGSYLAGSATGMALTSLAAGLLGLRKSYLGGLLLFTVMGGLCGFVSAVIWMTPLRLLQGLGAGLVLSPGMLLIWRAFPDRRDAAMTAYGLGVYLAVLSGAVLGGLIKTYLSWRWIFWLDLPAGFLILFLAWSLLDSRPTAAPHPWHFDVIGLVLFLSWVIAMAVALDLGQYWGWTDSPFFVPWLGLFVASFGGFVAWGLLHPRPLISLRPFGERNFTFGIILKVFFTANVVILLHALANYMINLRGYQWRQASLVLLPGLASFIAVSLVTLWWAKATNRRLRIALGGIVMAAATWALSAVDLYTSKYHIAAVLAIWGAGVGLALAPIMAVIFDGLTAEQTLHGAGVFNITRTLPVFALGTLLATALVQQSDEHFDRLRQRITHNRPLLELAEAQARQHFNDRGSGEMEEVKQTHALLARWTHVNARAYAVQDVLALLAIVTGCGSVVTLMVRK